MNWVCLFIWIRNMDSQKNGVWIGDDYWCFVGVLKLLWQALQMK